MPLDSAQIIVKQKLDELLTEINSFKSTKFLNFNLSYKFFKNKSLKSNNCGFYIYGDVGRGKTMLMQEFYKKITHSRKFYFHFNSFMNQVHLALRDIRKSPKKFEDELLVAISQIIFSPDSLNKNNSITIICFDEFQVVDVADAMLLSRIFSFFYSHKIITIITSNHHPLNLYPNGLQRESFIKFIEEILLKKITVLNLNSPHDYRLLNRTKISKKFFVNNKINRPIYQKILDDLTANIPQQTSILKVWGREIIIKNSFQNIAVFDFDDLCGNNFGASDYQIICQNYSIIFLKNIPAFSPEDLNEIRRFTLFIDEAYQHRNVIFFLSQKSLKNYQEITNFAPYFLRTISRINEIISDQY